jgi:hypothetical protein
VEISDLHSKTTVLESQREIDLLTDAINDSKLLANTPESQPDHYQIKIYFVQGNDSMTFLFFLKTMEEGYFETTSNDTYYILSLSATKKVNELLKNKGIL